MASIDDARKSVGWNASDFGNGYRSWNKERIVMGDRCNPAKDLPMVKSVFSLEHKEGKNSGWW